MNLLKIAELLTISSDEAFNFYTEVRQLSRLQPSTGLVLKNILRYLRENDEANITPLEIALFLDRHETELQPKLLQTVQPLEALLTKKSIVPKHIVPLTRPPLTSLDVLDEEYRRFIWKSRAEYTAEFKQRENTAFYSFVKEHWRRKGVTGDPHITVRRLDKLTKATLHFLAIKHIYTEADAKVHRGMDYHKEFLQSRYWTIISEYLRLDQRDYRDQCPVCDEPYPKHTEVHHKAYGNHGREHEHLEDLVVICNQCHSDISWNDRQQKLLDSR